MLDAMVPRVADVDGSIGTHGHAPRFVEGADRVGGVDAITEGAPLAEKFSIGREMQDAVVARVGCVEGPVGSEGQTARRIERGGLQAGRVDHQVRVERDGAGLVRVHFLHSLYRGHAVVPDLRGNILADVEAHLVGGNPAFERVDFGIEIRVVGSNRLGVAGVIAVEPDIPDARADVGVFDGIRNTFAIPGLKSKKTLRRSEIFGFEAGRAGSLTGAAGGLQVRPK